MKFRHRRNLFVHDLFIPSFSLFILSLSEFAVFTLLAQPTALRQVFISVTLYIIAIVLIAYFLAFY